MSLNTERLFDSNEYFATKLEIQKNYYSEQVFGQEKASSTWKTAKLFHKKKKT